MIDIIRPSNWPAPGSYTTVIAESAIEAMKPHIRASTLGGRSCVRLSGDRYDNLTLDQLVGHLGEYALSLYLTGSADLYFRTREQKDEHPEIGDGGSDLIGYPVDVKTSLWRYGNTRPRDYTLFVRRAEAHPGICYVLALVQGAARGALVHLMGWADDRMVRSYYHDEESVSQVPADALKPMDTLQAFLAGMRKGRVA